MSNLPKPLSQLFVRWNGRLAFAPLFAVICTALLLTQTGCAQTRRPAPVVDRFPSAGQPAARPKSDPQSALLEKPGFYVVKKGDTLYSVAMEHNVDYRDLADWNNIDQTQVIRIGQQLRTSPPDDAAVTAPLQSTPAAGSPAANADANRSAPVAPQRDPGTAPAISANAASTAVKVQPKASKLPYSDQALARLMTESPNAKPALANRAESITAKAEPSIAPLPPTPKALGEAAAPEAAAGTDEERIDWGWPAEGKIVAGFSEGDNLKGVDIAGKLGQPVIASAPGRVVYSGAGLRGYGKLVIIRHNKTYLSAYAHNSEILVKEGQSVAKGQKIAEMGNSDADRVKLHFEIRRLGKPVDPVKYLPDAKS
ncbi:MAG: peptidoglycan DD-metalloendopeptidase family protein [Burkholderiales bacterium]|nr:peptidoglycan DD-metalloendopeptidase family protein [Burkholderiales bacterium]MDQ3197517.1 peptidoglycan DD-metalloendopeptidase family protein [Pseudomonadota bacterium]